MIVLPQVRGVMPALVSVLFRTPVKITPRPNLLSCGIRARRGRIHLIGAGFATGTVAGTTCLKAECSPGQASGEAIEVEQKFEIEGGIAEKVAQSLDFMGSKRMEDSYFDTPSLVLTTSDNWLRLRDNSWELKQVLWCLKLIWCMYTYKCRKRIMS